MRDWLLAVGCAVLAAAGCATESAPPRARPLEGITKWLCYYGDDRRVLEVRDAQLLILDGDSIGLLSDADKRGRLVLAYLSLGEAEEWRWYWREVRDKPWVLPENPAWAGDHFVDPRSEEWRRLVVRRIAARLIAKGYDGFLLDTLDTVDFLLDQHPLRYEGAARGMVGIVRDLRRRYPQAVIVANGGFSFIEGFAPYVNAVMLEGVRSTWAGAEKHARRRRPDETAWIDARLRRAKALGLPVLALEYVDRNDAKAAAEVEREVRALGCIPFLGQKHLDWFPGREKRGS